jgi:hypothetical protein
LDPAYTKLKAEAGQTYYLRVWSVTTSMFGKIKFETVDDAEALRELPNSTFYATTLKQK